MSLNPIRKIGWVGLGNFGLPIAKRCLDQGYTVFGYTVQGRGKRGCEELVGAGGTLAGEQTISELDALVLCLPRSQDVQQVLEEFREQLPPIIIDLTTGHPSETAQRHNELLQRGILLVDSPVSGSKEGARNGQLTLFVGTEAGANASVDAFLQDIGGHVSYYGQPGNGHAAKLMNQLTHLAIMGVIGDTLHLANQYGLDLSTLVAALKTSSGNSAMLTRFGDSIVQGDFTPHFALELATKDVHLVDELATSLQLELPYHAVTKRVFEDAMERGDGALNFSVVCKK